MDTTYGWFGQAFRLNEICIACVCVILGAAPVHAQQIGATSVGNFQAQAGSATLAPPADPKQVLINLSNTKSVLQWDRLNVPNGSNLQFAQPNAQSIVLNRVASVDPARIDGGLSSNGQVWILSGAGVLFGPNSKVDVQSLLATTRDMSTADFLAGKYSLGGGGSGKVSNQGELAVADGGYVLLVGSEVDNQGRIQAQLGQVKLASGKAFVLDLNGDKLLRFDVTQALTAGDGQTAKVSNAGQIIADGGSVQMTARAARGLVAQVVNTGGLVQANSARMVNGNIVLDAGSGGEVVAGGQMSAQGLEQGAKGGNVTVVGDKITLSSDSRINVSGQAGGGTVLVGGDWQGRGSLQQATTIDMKAGAEIKANATTLGDGGKVVLWSDVHRDAGSTTVAGTIEAKGGVDGGDGGNVETSGRDLKIAASSQVNSGSPKGLAGQWLLDPVDVTIDAASASVIETALNSNYVLVTTAGSSTPSNVAPFTSVRVGESTGNGNIYVNAPMSWNKYVLSLEANGNVYINAPLTIGAIDNTYNPGTFGGLSIRTGYSTPGTNFGTYDTSKIVSFGMNSNGFLGRVDIQDSFGAARTGFGFRLNDADYTLIKDLAGFQNIASGLSGKYVLSGDLNASGFNAPIGNVAGIQYFTGDFIGLGHKITNLAISKPADNYVGLFSINAGRISSVGIEAGSVVGGASVVGSLVGINYGGTVINSYSKANVTGQWDKVGGLVGFSQASTQPAIIDGSFASGSVLAVNNTGGLVGVNLASSVADATIRNSYSTGNVSGASNGSGIFLGGLVGVNEGDIGNAQITNSYATGSIFTSAGLSGGLVGINANSTSIISDSYATGAVINTSANHAIINTGGVGGLVGFNDGVIARTYASGNVNSSLNTAGEGTGGLIGTNNVNGTVVNSYASGVVTGQYLSSGLVGLNNASASAISNSEALSAGSKLKQSSYVNFDFSNVWINYDGRSSPLLRSFLSPLVVTVSAPTIANKFYDGTTSYAGSGTVSYSIVPDNRLLGSLSYSTASSNVGLQQINVGGLYSDQQGYLISYANNMGMVNVIEESVRQSVQIAATSVSSSLSQLSNPLSAFSLPTLASTRMTKANNQLSTASTVVTGSTATTGAKTENAAVSGQSAPNVTTQVVNTSTTAETANISVSNQPTASTNLNATNTATTQTQTAAATGTAATEAKPQVTMVSMTALNVNTPTLVGAQTIAAIPTPVAPEDQRDPVLAAVSSFKPPVVLSASSGRAPNPKGQNQPVVVPLVQGVLALETLPPKAASQTVDEQRLSGAGNRSRW